MRPSPSKLRLVTGVRVTVRVKDKATGKPIPNATVHPGWSDLLDDLITDRDGLVQAQPLTAERWLLEVWADGFAKDSRWMNLENGSDADAEFLLEPGGDLEGVVRDPSGKPVAGVGLSIFRGRKQPAIRLCRDGYDGRYRLGTFHERRPPASSRWGPAIISKRIPTRLTGPRHGSISRSAPPARRLDRGRGPRSQGRPIAGAELVNTGNSSANVREAKTGPDGRFRLDNLYEANVGKEVLVRAKGFAPKRVKVETGTGRQAGRDHDHAGGRPSHQGSRHRRQGTAAGRGTRLLRARE